MVHFCHVYVEIKVMWAALEPCWCDLQGNCAVSTKFMRNLEEIQRTRAGAVQKLFHLINITFLPLTLVYVYHFHLINMCLPLLRDVYVRCSEHVCARAQSFEDKMKPHISRWIYWKCSCGIGKIVLLTNRGLEYGWIDHWNRSIVGKLGAHRHIDLVLVLLVWLVWAKLDFIITFTPSEGQR